MKDLIDRQDAIVALRNVWNALWEIDIPSPSAPEYIEHHEQVQGIMKMVQDMINTLPCTESQRESVQDVPDINVGNMISQQDAIKAVASAIWHYPNHSLLNNYHFAYELAEDALKRLPSAESWQQTGKWIYLGDGYKCPWSCSECDSCSDERTDYCPDCGAKMEGEQQ